MRSWCCWYGDGFKLGQTKPQFERQPRNPLVFQYVHHSNGHLRNDDVPWYSHVFSKQIWGKIIYFPNWLYSLAGWKKWNKPMFRPCLLSLVAEVLQITLQLLQFLRFFGILMNYPAFISFRYNYNDFGSLNLDSSYYKCLKILKFVKICSQS